MKIFFVAYIKYYILSLNTFYNNYNNYYNYNYYILIIIHSIFIFVRMEELI